MGQVTDSEIDQYIELVYTVIIDYYLTIELFFNQYSMQAEDSESQTTRFVTRQSVQQFFKDVELDIPTKIASLLLAKLDPGEQNKVNFLQVRNLFLKNLVDSTKQIIERLIGDIKNFTKERLTFTSLMFKFSKSSEQSKLIQVEKVNEAFIYIRSGIKHKDVSFLISYYGMRKTLKNEINYQELRLDLYNDASNYKLSGLEVLEGQSFSSQKFEFTQQFSNLDATNINKLSKIVLQLSRIVQRYRPNDILSYFEIKGITDHYLRYQEFKSKIQQLDVFLTEEDIFFLFKQLDKMDQNQISVFYFLNIIQFDFNANQLDRFIQRVGGIDVRRLQQCQTLLQDINFFLQANKKTPEEVFWCQEQVMNFIDFRYKLLDLGMNLQIRDVTKEMDMLQMLIVDPEDQNNVRVDVFLKILGKYNEKVSENQGMNIIFNFNTIIFWFVKIYDQMEIMGYDLSFFERYKEKQTLMKLENFEHVLFKVLQLQYDYYYPFLIQHLTSSTNPAQQEFNQKYKYVCLDKIRQGLEREQRARTILQKLRKKLWAEQLSIDFLVKSFNLDNNQDLNQQEFYGMIKQISTEPNDEDIAYLFKRMDISGDESINLKEI